MDILPDILAPGLKLVVCGSAAGTRSAQAGAYYAGPGNQFWGMLHRTGLTPTLLQPREFHRVIDHGIGLTDIVKSTFGSDLQLRAADFDSAGLRVRIETHQPSILAFNGKRAASAFFGRPVVYGYQHGQDIGRTQIHVGPSTSGAARKFWDEALWEQIAAVVSATQPNACGQPSAYGSTTARIAANRDSGR
jgi:TDG/mug DNA glycosylase family protein